MERSIACSPAAPAEARRAVALLASELDDGTMSDIELLVSELVTNSVRHSGSDEPITLRAWTRPGAVKVQISDGGRGFEARPSVAAVDAESGRGLLILESVSDRWGIDPDARTGVWFEIGHGPSGARAG